MLGLIVWIIIVVLIVQNIKKDKERQKKIQEEYSKKFGSSYERKDSRNSYYSDRKIEQYKKMQQDHNTHQAMEDDVCQDIGYKRCPKCDTMVSKRSDTCFMCGYSFGKDQR